MKSGPLKLPIRSLRRTSEKSLAGAFAFLSMIKPNLPEGRDGKLRVLTKIAGLPTEAIRLFLFEIKGKRKMTNRSRRNFLKMGCGALAGATMTSGIAITGVRRANAAVIHPFGYPDEGLDAEIIRQLGYDGYKGIEINGEVRKACAFGTFNAIISQLADIVGYPYDTIPTQMMEWAAGGVSGFGTLCGALNGACTAIGLICSNTDAKAFCSDLLSWYAETLLPTNLIAPTGEIVQSVAGSNLCHTSVTNWCLASGSASGSPERSERCAR